MVRNGIEFISNEEFYLFHEMMMKCLITDDVVTGLNESLDLLKTYLFSSAVVLHKKSEEGIYCYKFNDGMSTGSLRRINCVVNKISQIVERKEKFLMDLNLSDDFENMMSIYLKTHDSEYILSINNFDKSLKLDEDFIERLKNTMLVILKRAESYEHNIKAVTTDLLTNLDNRNSYEIRIKSFDEKTPSVYGIFDLFRLKNVNDNYGHNVGDIYIKEVAKILKKYWPKAKYDFIYGEKKEFSTGHCVYRIGGDEFVLLTTEETLDLTTIKAGLAAEEVAMIDLGIDEKPLLGLNYGIIEYTPDLSIKTAYEDADKIMSEDKRKMYTKYGLERRK